MSTGNNNNNDEDEVITPETMKRLVLKTSSEDIANCVIEIETAPVPKLQNGQVLIKVAAAAVNPSDYSSWKRQKPEDCPKPIGIEGSGIIVQMNADFKTSMMCKIGQKVGFVGLRYNQGAYSEYVVANALDGIFPMPDDLPVEDAASFFVNPYTTLAILDTTKSLLGCKSLIHTAAASQLGQMMVKLAPSKGIDVICIVRRAEQVEILKELNAKHIICSADDDWKDQLKKKVEELNCTVAFDAVAGEMTSNLLSVLPEGGTVYVYGGLAGMIGGINPIDLIYDKKTVKGFLVREWIQRGGMLSMVPRMLRAKQEVNSGLANGWSSSQFRDTTMETVKDDLISFMSSGITGKKLRVRMDKQ